MEVQTHNQPPIHKKKGAEYLLLFFIIFTAVFLGLLAYNWRVYLLENRKEVDYIHALVADIKSDTSTINQTINFNEGIGRADSSLLSLLRMPEKDIKTLHKIFILNPISQNFDYHINDSKTFDQLKYTGDFHLIRNKKVLAGLTEYYQQIDMINIFKEEIQNNVVLTYNLSFKVLDQYAYDNFADPSLALITQDASILNEYTNMLHNLIITYRMFNRMLRLIKNKAQDLLLLIDEEYTLNT
ncbi:MAG: hypothetical protein IPG60_11685 [Bacteroidetes bacterium]|nr:hypothetical protein [Bacteroidota bacterium]MBP8754011.1 hypothetical protein [Chitinophagales bacterium]MBP9119439.1 hypothetical protein [Ignavibacterium sp.]MBK8682614.1 hypothetical protein [Bacteroidota bacterium]MBP9188059.1 hypothetical protein [Chitinophagales bacterium]